jgi:hypothetical protein
MLHPLHSSVAVRDGRLEISTLVLWVFPLEKVPLVFLALVNGLIINLRPGRFSKIAWAFSGLRANADGIPVERVFQFRTVSVCKQFSLLAIVSKLNKSLRWSTGNLDSSAFFVSDLQTNVTKMATA